MCKFHITGLQLIPFQEYMYCVTANLLHGQIGPAKQTLTVYQATLLYSPKNTPALANKPTPLFLLKLLQKGAFLSKVRPPFMLQYMQLCKKHQRSSSVQEEGLTNEGRHNLLEALQNHCMCTELGLG